MSDEYEGVGFAGATIGRDPPDWSHYGMRWDRQCARCGSSMLDTDDMNGWVERCASSAEWCQANPLPGREDMERGQIEWFEVEA